MEGDAQPQLVSAEQVSAISHLSPLEIRNLVRSGHLPQPHRGLYNLSACIAGALRWFDENRKAPVMEDKEGLNKLTGLGDSMHRKLAAKGYFPPPRKGLYDLRATFAGMVKYLREHLQRRDQTMDERRGRKLDLEISLLEIEKATKDKTLISVDEIVARLSPAVTAMRQRILASTLTDQERDELIDDLGRLLCDALKQHESAPGSSQAAAANSDSAAAAHSQPVGG